MNADEIRAKRFPRGLRPLAYGNLEVREWFSILADALDAGVSPAVFRPRSGFPRRVLGYDCASVDQFLECLATEVSPGYAQPAWPGDPWLAAYGDAPVWDGSRGHHRDLPALDTRSRPQVTQECDAAWLRAGDHAGTRLLWKMGWPSTDILASNGEVVMTCGMEMTAAGSGQSFSFASGRPHRGSPGRERFAFGVGGHVVDAKTREPVFWMIGRTKKYHCGTVVLLPGQHWLRFSIEGSRHSNAVMTGLDENGTEVLRFRKLSWRTVEIILSHEYELTPAVLCVVAVAARFLEIYWVDDGGGGG